MAMDRSASHRSSGASPASAHALLQGLLEALPEAQRAELEGMARLRNVGDGTALVREGERHETVGYILSGALGMQKTLPDGRLHVIGLLVQHDMFGRLFDGPSGFDLVALAPAEVIEFEREAFEAFVARHPEAQHLLLTRILDEIDTAREWLLLMSGHKVVERVAAFLLILFRRALRQPGQKKTREIRIALPIRRVDLAHYLGTRPESLSRALHDLQREGAIHLVDPNTVEVSSLHALVRAAGSDLLLSGPGD
jgi:CRP/FNR family transcriptional regulator